MSIFSKIDDLKVSLSELATRIKIASGRRHNALKADNVNSVAGTTAAQIRTRRDRDIKNVHSADLKNNPHGVTAAQVGMPTKAQVDAQLNNLIPATVLPFSNFGTQDYLPIGVAGSFEGASTHTTRQACGLILEEDGTLVVLRNGTNGSKMGVYYGYLPNAELGPFEQPRRTNKAYRPSFFPENVRARHLIHASEYILIGQLADIATDDDAGIFISLTNGTYDDRLHVGMIMDQSWYSVLNTTTLTNAYTKSIIVGDVIYFIDFHNNSSGETFFGANVFTCAVSDIVDGRLLTIERMRDITTVGPLSTQEGYDAIAVFPKQFSTNPADNPLFVRQGSFSSFNIRHSGQHYIGLASNDDGLIRIALAHRGYFSTPYTSVFLGSVTSVVFDPSSRRATVDPGYPSTPITMAASADQRSITYTSGYWNNTAYTNTTVSNSTNGQLQNLYISRNGVAFGAHTSSTIDQCIFSRSRRFDADNPFDALKREETNRVSSARSGPDDPQFPTALGSTLSAPIYMGDGVLVLRSMGRSTDGSTVIGRAVTRLEGDGQYVYRSGFNAGRVYKGYSPSSYRLFAPDPAMFRQVMCEVSGQVTRVSGYVFTDHPSIPSTRRQFVEPSLTYSGGTLTCSNAVLSSTARTLAGMIPGIGTISDARGFLLYPQLLDIPPIFMVLVRDANTRQVWMAMGEVSHIEVTGTTISSIVLGDMVGHVLHRSATLNLGSVAYSADNRGAWCLYDTPTAVLIGGTFPINLSVVGNSLNPLVRLKWSKTAGRYVWDPAARQDAHGAPNTDYEYFVHPDHGLCQQNAGNHGSSSSDYFTKCLTASMAKTEAEFDAWVRPPATEHIVLAAQDVAEGYSVYFTDPVPLFMVGSSYILEPTDFDLRDIKTNPADTTFYVYVTLENNEPKYLVLTEETPETFTTMFIGTIVTNQTQIASINIDKVYRVDTIRISPYPVGSAIPSTAGHPADEERLTWT